MATEQEKKSPPPPEPQNNNANEDYGVKMTQKLIEFMGIKMPDIWRNSPNEENEKLSSTFRLPFGKSDNPGGVI